MPTIPWKLFWTVLGALAALALASVPAAYGLSPLFRLLISGFGAIALALAFSWGMGIVVRRAYMFVNLLHRSKNMILGWSRVAAGAHVVWVVAFAIRPDLWVVWIVALLVLAFVTFWVAKAQEYLLTQVRPTPAQLEASRVEAMAAVQAAIGPAAGGTTVDDDVTRQLKETLRRARKDYLTILDYEEIGEPVPFGVRVRLRRPSQGVLLASGEKASKSAAMTELTPSDAESIAIALSEVLNTEILSDFVQVRKLRAAGTYALTIVHEDVMARVYEYHEPTFQWTSIREPALVGYGMDGKPVYLLLKQHGQAIGRSTSGKSSLIHVIIAHITKSADCVLWICGVEKLYDLVAGWLECYMDTDLPLPMDWVVNGQGDTLDMLIAAMHVARWRQKAPMSERGNWPTIIVVLDEASFALKNPQMSVYQGQRVTASDMVAMLVKGAASADVHIIVASQRSTNDNFGDAGGDVTTNIGWSAAFMSRDEAEVGRLMGDYSLPMPRHRGQYWLDDGDGGNPQQVKAPYIQSVDPTKPTLSNGPTIAEVSRARASLPQVRRGLDPGSAKAAGEAYARRHTRMTLAMQNYLRGVDEDEVGVDDGPQPAVVNGETVGSHVSQPAAANMQASTVPASENEGGAGIASDGIAAAARDATMAQVAAKLAAAGVAAGGPAGAARSSAELSGAVAVLDRPEPVEVGRGENRTWQERILALLRERGRLGRAEIIQEFGRESEQVVQNTLTKLFSKGQVERENGVYWLPETDSDGDSR